MLAVSCVIAGVGIVGLLTDDADKGGSKRTAMFWASTEAAGFFLSFAPRQSASQADSECPVIFVARLIAVAAVLVLIFGSGQARMPARSAWQLLGLMGVPDCLAPG